MSYIFSRALVEEFSRAKCSDTDASVLLNGSHTPPLFLPSDKTTAFSRLSRFGMTFGHLTDDLGAELLTSWLAGFRAKTSALPEKAQASPESAQECGPTWRASLARFDPASCSWKTAQHSLLGDSEECSVTWPRSGMTAGGQCWELPTLARRTSGTGSGLSHRWLFPTPTCNPEAPNHGSNSSGPHNLKEVALNGWSPGMMWPTPTSTLGTNGGRVTPTKAREGGTLIEALSARTMWPTPTASNTKANHMRGADNGKAREPRSYGATGQLNPTWVEWLMGWPLGWTDLRPLETGRFHSAPQQHSEYSQTALELEE